MKKPLHEWTDTEIEETRQTALQAARVHRVIDESARSFRALDALLASDEPPTRRTEPAPPTAAPTPAARAAGLEHAVSAGQVHDASDEAQFELHFNAAVRLRKLEEKKVSLEAEHAALTALKPQTIPETDMRHKGLEHIAEALRLADEELEREAAAAEPVPPVSPATTLLAAGGAKTEWTPHRRAELLKEFRALEGRRPQEAGKKGKRGALMKLVGKSAVDKDTLGDQLDKAVGEKKMADMWEQLNTAK